VSYDTMAVMVTARSRPEYLVRTLGSWGGARHTGELHSFTIALGQSDMQQDMLLLMDSFDEEAHFSKQGIRLLPDSTRAAVAHGMHTAIAEAVTESFTDSKVEFVIAGEEDVVVSSDVLEYMNYGMEMFRNDHVVLAVCAHDVGGTGWDVPGVGQRSALAHPARVRLRHYFNPWVWGTWRDRWENVLLPRWEYCNPPVAGTGWDWNIATSVLPRGEYFCLVPDASRSQNIGEHGGVYSTPDIFAGQQTLSFEEHREPVTYALTRELT
jgi:hypothetical protein